MAKGNKLLGAWVLLALLCALAVFVVEEIKYKANEVHFEEQTAVSENAIDINTASVEELQELDGIGESMAEKIVNFRKTIRPFETVYDLKLIKGFGEKRLTDNIDMMSVK
ncbi:MAG: helix-hairpin-helix domain-containing protein [Clostridia bacterium]|nr:helix-hairpin-helix domain-containing protein [Clostridia bacterium]